MIILTTVFIFILGTAIGSFLNVLIDRLPQGKSIGGRSHCDYCEKQLTPVDLVPVLSFIFLRGKCRYCHKKLSIQYPLMELLTGVIFVLGWLFLPMENLFIQGLHPIMLQGGLVGQVAQESWWLREAAGKLVYLGVISCLIVIFFADWRFQIIPDSLQVALFTCALVFFAISGAVWDIFVERMVAAAIVMAPILFLFLVTRGRGMGFGDVKLAFVLGFLLGWLPGLLSLYFAFIFGAIYGLGLIATHKGKMKSKIAFGPFIVLGMLIMIFFQQPVYFLIHIIYGI